MDAIRAARELDLLTCPYVFTPEDARAMAEAGADVLVPHMGLTTGGSIGAETARTLDESVELIQAMHDAAVEVAPDVLVSATAARSPSPRTRPTCSSARGASSASSAPRAWSGSRPRSR